MKTRNILYIIAGVFNCIVGGLGVILTLLILLLSKIIKQMFEQSKELVDKFFTSLAEEDAKYEYLKSLSDAEAVDYIMKIVYIFSIVLLVLGAIWITFGVFNLLLKSRHDSVFGTKRYLKHLFVVGSWLLLGLNVANILTTIAVYKKIKEEDTPQVLYTAK